MATQAQINANRRNARRSTGPRTAAGKARVSRNAVKHGLRSKEPVEPNPSDLEFRELLANWESTLALTLWRYSRVCRLEVVLLSKATNDSLPATLAYLTVIRAPNTATTSASSAPTSPNPWKNARPPNKPNPPLCPPCPPEYQVKPG